ncbi:MAG: restriction endonuclease subunit S [Muribaculaceae bacterium]|nr:restriction endonuclease subunit S [Muribaculaceae bacterium]
MKHNWEYKRLGDVCEINYGTRIVAKETEPGEYKVYGGGGATFSTKLFNRENCMIVSRFAMSSTCVRFVAGKFFLNDSGLSVKQISENLLQKYVDKFLWANQFQIYNLGRGLAQKNLDVKKFLNITIPVPPREVQEQIVAELDTITEGIAALREQVADLDRLAQTLFYETFGDPITNPKGYNITKLSDVCSLITDGTHQTPTYTDDKINGVKFLSAKDVVNGYIDWNNIKYIPFNLHKELHKRLAPKRGDILLCKNGTTGIAALVETDEVFDIYVSLALLRANDDIDKKYLLYAINNPFTKEQFTNSLIGIGVPNLHLNKIRNTKIIVPPLSLQQRFAEQIEAIEAMKATLATQVADAQTLLDSRIDYWFN